MAVVKQRFEPIGGLTTTPIKVGSVELKEISNVACQVDASKMTSVTSIIVYMRRTAANGKTDTAPLNDITIGTPVSTTKIGTGYTLNVFTGKYDIYVALKPGGTAGPTEKVELFFEARTVP